MSLYRSSVPVRIGGALPCLRTAGIHVLNELLARRFAEIAKAAGKLAK